MSLTKKAPMLLTLGLAALFSGAFLRVHMRVQSTLIGYELGRLKSAESELLERRSSLQMELARLTTKGHLSMMVSAKDAPASRQSFAVR